MRCATWGVFVGAALLSCNAILGIGDPVMVDGPEDAVDASDSAIGDAGEDADAAEAAAPVSCAHGSPFGAPRLVPGLEDKPIIGARLNASETNIYVSLVVGEHMDLFVGGRTSSTEKFASLTKLQSVSTMSDDYWPTVDSNELLMFFESGLVPSEEHSSSRIWFTSRDTTNEEFRKATLTPFFSNLPEGATDSAPYLASSGDVLYFTSIRRPLGTTPETWAPSQDLWAIQTNASGTTLYHRRLIELSMDDWSEQFPVITSDQREIFFSRAVANGSDDNIFVAQRTSAGFDTPFETPAPLDDGGINTIDRREWPSWVSDDGCRLYFVRSSTSGLLSESRLWMATRSAQ